MRRGRGHCSPSSSRLGLQPPTASHSAPHLCCAAAAEGLRRPWCPHVPSPTPGLASQVWSLLVTLSWDRWCVCPAVSAVALALLALTTLAQSPALWRWLMGGTASWCAQRGGRPALPGPPGLALGFSTWCLAHTAGALDLFTGQAGSGTRSSPWGHQGLHPGSLWHGARGPQGSVKAGTRGRRPRVLQLPPAPPCCVEAGAACYGLDGAGSW